MSLRNTLQLNKSFPGLSKVEQLCFKCWVKIGTFTTSSGTNFEFFVQFVERITLYLEYYYFNI